MPRLTVPPRRLADFGIADELALLGSLIAGPLRWSALPGRAANTDDRPIVAYRAPRITYAPDSLPRDRLLALLHELRIEPDELLRDLQDGAGVRAAPGRLLVGARPLHRSRAGTCRPSPSVQRMLAQVREPLLGVLRISPDFRPAYDPLLRMASALARTDPGSARQLLEELKKIQPGRPEADQALQRMASAP